MISRKRKSKCSHRTGQTNQACATETHWDRVKELGVIGDRSRLCGRGQERGAIVRVPADSVADVLSFFLESQEFIFRNALVSWLASKLSGHISVELLSFFRAFWTGIYLSFYYSSESWLSDQGLSGCGRSIGGGEKWSMAQEDFRSILVSNCRLTNRGLSLDAQR